MIDVTFYRVNNARSCSGYALKSWPVWRAKDVMRPGITLAVSPELERLRGIWPWGLTEDERKGEKDHNGDPKHPIPETVAAARRAKGMRER